MPYKDLKKKKRWLKKNRERLKAYYKKDYYKNRKARKKKTAEWRRKNKKRYQEYNRKHRKERNKAVQRFNRSPIGRYTFLIRISKKMGHKTNISFEEYCLLLVKPCFYCGDSLNKTGSGLDRKNSKIGYMLKNVVPCCKVCNFIKNKYLTYDEMVVAMKAILKLRRKKDKI